MSKETYIKFLKDKATDSAYSGFDLDRSEINPMLFEHQKDVVQWNVLGGRRACFMSFGLGKTFVQIETARLIIEQKGGKALFIAPLGVRHQFTIEDGPKLGVNIQYVKDMNDVENSGPFVITNYDRIRLGHINPEAFTVVCLDEASVLRSTGSETFEVFMAGFKSVPFRFVFTATPSPNRYLELINYADFLGIMDRGQALTRFFKRDSQNAGNLRIHPHKQREFWLWLCTWACMIYKPSDLGYSDEGYDLPRLNVIYHEIKADHTKAWDTTDDRGQRFLLQHEAMGLVAGAKEKKESLDARLQKCIELVNDNENVLIWHHLESERVALEKAIPETQSVYGSLDIDERERRIIDFSNGKIRVLATKPELSGSGCNFQRHCSKNVFLGINYDFNDFIQAVHRTYRFLQTKEVEVHIIHTETERAIVNELKLKWQRHNELQNNMRQIFKEYGLDGLSIKKEMQRSVGVERKVLKGENFEFINNDCVLEMMDMPENSIDHIVTSIPFSNHYEYTPSYNDFGHTDNDAHFFEQMDFLVPEMLRILKPGRIAAIHVKDRIFYGSQTGTGFSTVNPFHATTIFEFMKHGFEYMGMAVIHTDVVAENNQTYRLGFSEMKKDATKMGFGSPEFLLSFRKRPTSNQNSYADDPVKHEKYGMGRWQIIADANWRSSGDRHLPIDEFLKLSGAEDGAKSVRKRFRNFFETCVYNFEDHVKLADGLSEKDRLPKVFSLLSPPPSGSAKEFVWDDVLRMGTLNADQVRRGAEKHICPLQFDIVDRSIEQYTNPGETVFDPFGGIGTVPYRAVLLGRKGKATELNTEYWKNGCHYLKAAEYKINTPTLFDAFDSFVEHQQAA